MPTDYHMPTDTLDWLLEPDEPSVRYFALRDLLGRPEHDTEVLRAKSAIMEQGPVAKILAHQNDDGGFMTAAMVRQYGLDIARSGYRPKYKNTTWQLLFLAQLGADRDDPRIKKLCEYVLDNNYVPGRDVMGIHIRWRAGLDFYLLPCFIANMVWSLTEMGCYGDPRVQDSIRWLLKYQRFDDGDFRTPDEWPYKGRRDRCFGRHTCFSGVTRVLNLMTAVPESERTGEMGTFIGRAVDFVLLHRLYRKNHGNWKPIRPEFELFTFPLIHYDDVISVIDTLQRLGVRDKSIDEGLEYILSKRGPDGRWNLGYTMSRGSTYANFGQRGTDSKWITLRALKVLKNAGMVDL